jgi:ankyrin repeat protein
MIDDALRQNLERAFRGRDIGELRELLSTHPAARGLINEPLFPFDSPALVHVAGEGNLELVNLLLEFGADPNRRSDWWAGGFHVLHSARGAVAERLIEAGAIPDACAAAQLDRVELLEQLLDAEPGRVNERGGDGQTPLHFARSREVVDLLLARGADLNARDVDHRATPAEWMLEQKRGAGRYDLADYLVRRGASADIFLAAALGLTDRIRELVDSDDAVLELRSGRGVYDEKPPSSFHIYTWSVGQHRSPLQVAAQFHQREALRLLLSVASPAERLLDACVRGDTTEAREIVRGHPGLISQLTPEQQSVLPDAGWAGNTAAVTLMLDLDFDPRVKGAMGGSVLHTAAAEGVPACVEAALRSPRVRELLNESDPVHGSSPLGWCCWGACHSGNRMRDHATVARMLLDAGARPVADLESVPEEVATVIREFGKTGD